MNFQLFNQITLTCDWWFNVDCSQAKQFYDYSNTRLYAGEDVTLLDNQNVYNGGEGVAAQLAQTYGGQAAGSGHRSESVRVHGSAQSSSQSNDDIEVLSSQDIYNAQGDTPQPAHRKKHKRKHQ